MARKPCGKATVRLADEKWTPEGEDRVLISGRYQDQVRRDRVGALSFGLLARRPSTRPKLRSNVSGPLIQVLRGQREGVDLLYLFACATLWHSKSEAGAGWELIRALKSAQPGAQVAPRFSLEPGIWSCHCRTRSACRPALSHCPRRAQYRDKKLARCGQR